jgi:two-component system, cell cycle response regulator
VQYPAVGVRGRLLLGTIGVVVITALMMLALVLRLERDDDRNIATVRLLELIETMSVAVALDLQQGNPEHARALLLQLQQSQQLAIDSIMLVTSDGYDIVASAPVDLANDGLVQRVMAGDKIELWPPPPASPQRVAYALDSAGLRYAITVTLRDELVQGTRGRLLRLLALCILVGMVAASVVWLGLEIEVLRPLRRLRTMAEAMRGGSLTARVAPLGGTEFRALGATLNDAAAQLQESKAVLESAVLTRTAELTAANTALENLARTDALTGLHNRRAFDEYLAQESARQTRHRAPFAIAMIDVDHFKSFNDHHGHPEGDVLLRSLSTVLSKHIRATDLLARIGGEEFAVLLLGTSPDDAVLAAEKLRVAVVDANLSGGNSQPLGRVSVSIGVAAGPDHGLTPSEILAAADEALYAAKRGGRNAVRLAGVA